MNRIATTPRGFPFDELSLKEIQEQTVPVLNAIAKLIPDKSIIYGCQFNWETLERNDGFIIWDGELMPFVGGPPSAQFSIVEEVIERAFNIGTDQDPQLVDKPAYYKRFAKIGTVPDAESVHDLSALKRTPKFLTYLQKGRRFIGTVVPHILQGPEGPGTIVTIDFESVGTSNYMVLGNFYRANSAANGHFNYDIFEKAATGFKVRIKDVGEPISMLQFDYLVVPSNLQLTSNP